MFGGVPACPEASCSGQDSYTSQSVISGNTFVNNGGNVFLWQNSDRYCSAGFDNVCTLVGGGRSGPFTMSACKSNLRSASINTTTYARGNDRVGFAGLVGRLHVVDGKREGHPEHHRLQPSGNRALQQDCLARLRGRGDFRGIRSSPPYNRPGGWAILSQVTFFENDTWSDNVYNGPSTFYAWNQGNGNNPVSWADWTGEVSKGDKCSSAGDRQSGACTGPFGQDSGSTYYSSPVASASSPPAAVP